MIVYIPINIEAGRGNESLQQWSNRVLYFQGKNRSFRRQQLYNGLKQ
jgi:hypothetical protein